MRINTITSPLEELLGLYVATKITPRGYEGSYTFLLAYAGLYTYNHFTKEQ